MTVNDSQHNTGDVVQTIFTETSVFVAPDGERYPYIHLVCGLQDGRQGANLLFNGQMACMLLDAVNKYMGTVFGVPEVGSSIEQAMDEPIDWDSMPPAPDDIVDFDPDQEPDPDYRHDDPDYREET